MNQTNQRARTLRHTTTRYPALALLAFSLSGCAGLGLAPAALGPVTQTVTGDYEVIATCVAAAGENSVGGAPELRTDRAKKVATVRRVLQPSNQLQYEIVFVQIGAATVRVDGRGGGAAQEGARGFGFLWPHVGLCETRVMAP